MFATSILFTVFSCASCAAAEPAVGHRLTDAVAADGTYISWREHIIDSKEIAGFNLTGSDGLVMADLDLDGFADIVSVHESDDEYDSAVADEGYSPDAGGHVRIAFGSAEPLVWHSITLAEAPAPEDADIADVNGDGFPDIIVAVELAYLIYFQNPGASAREEKWQRLILPMTKDRGSYIRVFFADLDEDGRPEALAANKGAQRPSEKDALESNPVSMFKVKGDPLQGNSWTEVVLGRYSIPQNSEPVDLDGDGDLDIVIGSRGEQRIAWFENRGKLQFAEHAIGVVGAVTAGFNMDYADLNHDGRLDIVATTDKGVAWFEQPQKIDDAWPAHHIGTFAPDFIVGLALADIDGDGHQDLFAGSYSRGSRLDERQTDVNSPLGRLGWFKNPGELDGPWLRHDVSRRKRGMFDKFVARDMDGDGDVDFVSTRGNSGPFDGVFWLEQIRTKEPVPRFDAARETESEEAGLPQD